MIQDILFIIKLLLKVLVLAVCENVLSYIYILKVSDVLDSYIKSYAATLSTDNFKLFH